MTVQITLRFDPRQQPQTVLNELVSDLDAQVFQVHLEEAGGRGRARIHFISAC